MLNAANKWKLHSKIKRCVLCRGRAFIFTEGGVQTLAHDSRFYCVFNRRCSNICTRLAYICCCIYQDHFTSAAQLLHHCCHLGISQNAEKQKCLFHPRSQSTDSDTSVSGSIRVLQWLTGVKPLSSSADIQDHVGAQRETENLMAPS